MKSSCGSKPICGDRPGSLVEDAVEFLLGAARVVAQGLHLVAGFRPGALQVDARFAQQLLALRMMRISSHACSAHADEVVKRNRLAQRCVTVRSARRTWISAPRLPR